jgi:hypothetical protein
MRHLIAPFTSAAASLRALALPLLYRPQQLSFSFRKEKKLAKRN